MNIEEFRDYCLLLPETTEGFPFGEDTLVLKVRGKVYALASLEPFSMNLKCDPERAQELREQYPDIVPGYHMNKKHWNTLYPNGTVNNRLIRKLIAHSYNMVIKGMSAKERTGLASSGE